MSAKNPHRSNTSTEPVQISVLACYRSPIPRQYRWKTSSQVTFRSRAGGRPCLFQHYGSTAPSKVLARYQAGCKFPPGPRWKSRIYASIYKRNSTTPVVNKEKCLYWTFETRPGLARYWHSKAPVLRPSVG